MSSCRPCLHLQGYLFCSIFPIKISYEFSHSLLFARMALIKHLKRAEMIAYCLQELLHHARPIMHSYVHKRLTLIRFSQLYKLLTFTGRLLRIGPSNVSDKRQWTVRMGGKEIYSFTEHSYQSTHRQQHPLLRC